MNVERYELRPREVLLADSAAPLEHWRRKYSFLQTAAVVGFGPWSEAVAFGIASAKVAERKGEGGNVN